MTTTSEKILSEMERMGRMKIKDLCAQMDWQYQKFRRGQDGNHHPIDPKTGDFTDGYHDPTDEVIKN